MISPGSNTIYIFVIDTDQYAGNFEREMVAFMTGCVGECGVGDEYAEMYRDRFNIDEDDDRHNEYIFSSPDDHGCHRPATTWPTPGWFNDGMGNMYREGTDEKIAVERYITERQAEIDKADNDYDKESLQEDIEQVQKEGITKWPAANSVGIFMERLPTDEEAKRLIERAIEFVKMRETDQREWKRCNITVEGFRLIQQRTTEMTARTWHISSKDSC